ncbi:MAG: phosphatase PAP2 family protein [Rickettsiales bacterium]|jgi:membrane-associated phospholipid phosphatase|nr:phosphatase PAP2 family protein [Rickettsiales bacterium]
MSVKKNVFVILPLIAAISGAEARKNPYAAEIMKIGDFIKNISWVYAYGTALYHRDKLGALEYFVADGLARQTSSFLKRNVDESRPDKSQNDSFPSGHATTAFSMATFIHARYGIEEAIVPYVMATYVGFSRVYGRRHYIHDVVAGAAIAGMFSWIIADKYPDKKITLSADSEHVYLGFSTMF